MSSITAIDKKLNRLCHVLLSFASAHVFVCVCVRVRVHVLVHIYVLLRVYVFKLDGLHGFPQIFSLGMLQELGISREMVDRIFPQLDELLDIHLAFLHGLIQAQKRSVDKSIDDIGLILIQQVSFTVLLF